MRAKLKRILWPKKTSRKFLMVCLYVAVGYLILGGFGIVPLVATSTGFMSVGPDSINGIPVGSSQFTQSGQFSFSSGGINWNGRVVVGNTYYDGQSDLGFLTNGNTSTALRELNYHTSVLVYTLQPYTDMLPGITAVQNGIIGTQYKYREYGIFNEHQSANDATAYLRANYLSIPSNYLTLLSGYLNLNIGVRIQLDPSLLVITSYQTSEQYFNMSGVWAGVLSANAGADHQGGLISAPGTVILDANFTQKPSDAVPGSASGYSASSVAGSSAVGTWLDAHDPSGVGNHFQVTSVDSTMYKAGAVELGMGAGDPVALTEGDWNANATINQALSYTDMLGDEHRNYVIGYIPVTLRPETTITQTTYTYNSFDLGYYFWGGLSGTAYLGKTVTVPTSVSTKNPFDINLVNFKVLVGANYTITDLNDTSTIPDIKPPIVNGTDDVFNTMLTSQVHDVATETTLGFGDILDMLGGIGIWVIVILLIAVAAVLVWRFAKPGKKRK